MFQNVAYLSHSYGSDHEVGQLLLAFNSDADPTVNFFAIFAGRPILDAHDLQKLKSFYSESF